MFLELFEVFAHTPDNYKNIASGVQLIKYSSEFVAVCGVVFSRNFR